MTAGIDATRIGYSVFNTSEECYEYCENACYIAANLQTAKRFLDTSFFPGDCEIRSVAWDDLRKDYGCSGGEYAMEADAFARFQSLAQQHGVTYQAEAFNGDESIMIVEINHEFLIRGNDV